jgi:hypothetical protein
MEGGIAIGGNLEYIEKGLARVIFHAKIERGRK